MDKINAMGLYLKGKVQKDFLKEYLDDPDEIDLLNN